jgi:membrane-associated phospholipid phosphatase
MHVYGSVVLAAALIRSRIVKGYIKISGTVLAVLICLSTVFVKQHSIIDLVAAVILFAILHTVYIIVEKIKGAR